MAGDGLHVVLGAAGGTGRAITEALLERGPRVRAVTRKGTGVPARVVSSDAACQAAFGPQPATLLEEAVSATVAWNREAGT